MSLVALYYYCAVSRNTPGPFSVSASASAESLPASTARDFCPGIGVAHGRVASYTSTEGNRIFTPYAPTSAVPQQPPWAQPLYLHDASPAPHPLLEAHQP